MRKLIIAAHISLDGYLAGPHGEMDWIYVDEEILNYTVNITNQADAAIYGRVTFQMMDAYWPNAGDQPGASLHDRDHSAWYNRVEKYVLSNTLELDRPKTTVLSGNIAEKIEAIKSEEGKALLMFGSPRAAQSLLQLNLVDELWLFINPIVLGKGMPLFNDPDHVKKLKLIESKVMASRNIEVHYEVSRD